MCNPAGGVCLTSESNIHLYEGNEDGSTALVIARVKIPLGTKGGFYNTRIIYGGTVDPQSLAKDLSFLSLRVPSKTCTSNKSSGVIG